MILHRDKKKNTALEGSDSIVRAVPATPRDMSAGGEKPLGDAVWEPGEIDEMTGILTRPAFTRRVDRLIRNSAEGRRHAFIILDISGCVRLNEVFGHSVGDEVMISIARALKTVIRGGDLLGRLGGYEFFVCLRDIPNETEVERKAVKLRSALRGVDSLDVPVSAGMGIAVFPDDGGSFEELYRHADEALHYARAGGGDALAFYDGRAKREAGLSPRAAVDYLRNRVLIVGEDESENERLWFALEGFNAVEVRTDGRGALEFLSRFGDAVDAILLDLDMTETDGFALLDDIRTGINTRDIPVIALSGKSEWERRRLCREQGVSALVEKPADSGLIRTAVEAAVVKADNIRLRAQNSYLMVHGSAGSMYEARLERINDVKVEYDRRSGRFTYDPKISEVFFGHYDGRSLWHILLSDMVASARDVKAMQSMVIDLAGNDGINRAAMEVLLKTPLKSKRWFRMEIQKPPGDERGATMDIFFTDVNDAVSAREKLRFQTDHDSLTGLLNRSAFIREAENMVKRAPDGSYMLVDCDLDRFKSVNERFGRAEGDRLLLFTAEKLMAHAEMRGGLCGRMSTDTFAVLLPYVPGFMTRLCGISESFFSDYDLDTHLRCSCGVLAVTDAAVSMETLLERAASAMNEAQKSYAARAVLYDDALHQRCLMERYVTEHMEAALSAGEFGVYFQPQFDHATGQLVGAEALARWNDPEKGMISPGVFIPVFEKTNFISQMDEYIWERTAKAFEEWVDAGLDPLPVSINLSRETLYYPQFGEKLLAMIRKHGLPVNMFRLELAESLFVEDTENVIAVLDRLHELGFVIGMDDFGSGSSSLNILKDIRIDYIKIDMRFFSEGKNVGRGGIIINSVIRMARWLGIETIAEGVETNNQADFLLSLGCRVVQGYLYEKPIPMEEFKERLLKGSPVLSVESNAQGTDIDVESFWDHKSVDSQVFNDFIGPAVLFEYCYGEYELVRMNKQMYKALGINSQKVVIDSVLQCFCDEDRLIFQNSALDAVSSGKPTSVDVRGIPDAVGRRRKLHLTLRPISNRDERSILIAIAN